MASRPPPRRQVGLLPLSETGQHEVCPNANMIGVRGGRQMPHGTIDEAAYEAILKELTPRELAVEYTRVVEEPPPKTATVRDLTQRILATVRAK